MNETLIFEPFNGTFWLITSVFAAGTAICSIIARKKGTEFARKLLGTWCLIIVAYYIVFKVCILLDEEYALLRIAGGMPEVSIWTELPIQLCDINLLMLPYAVLSRRDVGFLRFFVFCFGIIGAFFAIIMPFPGFTGYSILIPRVLGYYFTHYSIIFSAISLISFGLYKPSLKDFRYAIAALTAVFCLSFAVNIVLRATGASEAANYFFSYEPVGLSVLELFYSMIPVPGLYLAVPVFTGFAIIYAIAAMVVKCVKHFAS